MVENGFNELSIWDCALKIDDPIIFLKEEWFILSKVCQLNLCGLYECN